MYKLFIHAMIYGVCVQLSTKIHFKHPPCNGSTLLCLPLLFGLLLSVVNSRSLHYFSVVNAFTNVVLLPSTEGYSIDKDNFGLSYCLASWSFIAWMLHYLNCRKVWCLSALNIIMNTLENWNIGQERSAERS